MAGYKIEGRILRTEIKPKVLERYPKKDQIIFILNHLPEIEDPLLEKYTARFPVLRTALRNHRYCAAEIYEELTKKLSSDPEREGEIRRALKKINSTLKRMNARCYREIVLHDSYAEERKKELRKAAREQKAAGNDGPLAERICKKRGKQKERKGKRSDNRGSEETPSNVPRAPLIKLMRIRTTGPED